MVACPLCARPLVLPSGPQAAALGLIGEFPGETELRLHQPFCGPAGAILRQELARLGIMWGELRMTNLWEHAALPQDEKELNWHTRQALLAVKNCPVIVLLGSEVVSLFLNEKVSNVAGIWHTQSAFFGERPVLPLANPAIALHQPLGEFRWGLEILAKGLKTL